jgi:hypothetical protein
MSTFIIVLLTLWTSLLYVTCRMLDYTPSQTIPRIIAFGICVAAILFPILL